jgi:hypothetical protein
VLVPEGSFGPGMVKVEALLDEHENTNGFGIYQAYESSPSYPALSEVRPSILSVGKSQLK